MQKWAGLDPGLRFVGSGAVGGSWSSAEAAGFYRCRDGPAVAEVRGFPDLSELGKIFAASNAALGRWVTLSIEKGSGSRGSLDDTDPALLTQPTSPPPRAPA